MNSNGLVVCFTISSSLDVYKVESDSKTLGAAFSLFFLLSLPYILIISEFLEIFKFYTSIGRTVRISPHTGHL